MRFFVFAVSISLLAGTTVGCGPDNGLHLAKVRGKVLYDGKPVSMGSIMFEPEVGPPAVGSIGSDGSFVLSTENAGDGAVVGPHRISVMSLGESADPKSLPNPETSPREFMVAKSQLGAPSRAKKKQVVETLPASLADVKTSNLKAVIKPGSNVLEIAIAEDGSTTVSP